MDSGAYTRRAAARANDPPGRHRAPRTRGETKLSTVPRGTCCDELMRPTSALQPKAVAGLLA